MQSTYSNASRSRGSSESRPSLRSVVSSTLHSSEHSPTNRRKAQDLAWDWVRAKWPRLMPSQAEIARGQYERSLPGQQLAVNTSSNGRVWTLSLAHNERNGQRTWLTRVQVSDTGTADMLDLQAACTDIPDAPLVVAPPKLLGAWVERLDLRDGGVPIVSEAREVANEQQLAAFLAHVASKERRLPVIALTNTPRSRYFGVDPRGLAEAVRGLAHVACVSPEMAVEVKAQFGPGLGLSPGAARIYAPQFHLDDASIKHPLVRDNRPQGEARTEDPGAFRRRLCQKICAMSVVNAPAGT